MITDLDGAVLYANEGASKITGFPNKEIIGKKAGAKELWGGLMDEKFYAQMWDTIKNKKQTFSGEINNQRKNGEKYVALSTISPVLDEDDELIYFVGIERDITTEKAVDRAKSEFVSLASHQLRTPLSSINWYTEMLLDDKKNLKKEQKEFLNEIVAGSKRMVTLVNDLLNVSRLELGHMMIKPKKIDMVQAIQESINQHKFLLEKKKGQVKFKDRPKELMINLDPILFNQVIGNLLSNAIKYSPPDRCKIEIKIEKINRFYEVTVSDKGMGIPKANQAKIFSKLYRADNARKSMAEGSGLGLYIIKTIMEESGGKISFKSEQNKGTTFYLRFPLKGMKEVKGDKGFSE